MGLIVVALIIVQIVRGAKETVVQTFVLAFITITIDHAQMVFAQAQQVIIVLMVAMKMVACSASLLDMYQ